MATPALPAAAAAAAAYVLAAAMLLPLVSSLPQLRADSQIVFSADDDSIDPRFLAGGTSANEVGRSTRYPGGWGRPLFITTTPKPEQPRRQTRPPYVDYDELFIFDRPSMPIEYVPRTTSPATTTGSGSTRENCNCPTTNEYNPVCGTDHVTYSNPGHVYCAKYCGKTAALTERIAMATQVSVTAAAAVIVLVGLLVPQVFALPQFEREPEFPPDADEDDIEPWFLTRGWPGNEVHPDRWQPDDWRPPFFPHTTSRHQRFFTTTTSRPPRRQQQPRRPELDWPPPPPQDLDWRPRPPQGPRPSMRPPTPSVGVRRTTSRPTTSRPMTNRPITSRPITNRPNTSRPTTPSAGAAPQDCNCPSTNEFNPVCGTDGVSYPNPGRLRCAKDCGKRVSVYHIGNCVTTSTSPPSRVGSGLPP
ncbi:salivary glue protein Sgs-3-like [Schistocerca cancellata]|uniref:salivary glue protein Sgs-3-like n=1 Tax=Schistocerca cancellata TaxID=274614 RepID=UPI0021182306|nr:salivary glue protein Sgs-3-like [Schistocerca cancellata]